MARRAYVLILLHVLVAGATTGMNLLPGPFFEAISKGNKSKVASVTIIGLVSVTVTATLRAVMQYFGEVLIIRWRQVLTRKVHEAYFRKNLFYYINGLDKRVDNADQRITQDIGQFCTAAGGLLFGSFKAPSPLTYIFTMLVLSVIFLMIRVTWLPLAVGSGFAVVVVIVMTVVLIPVARYTFRVNEKQGTFRFQHARLTEFAESITFYGGHKKEQHGASNNFDLMYVKARALYFWNFVLNIWNQFAVTVQQVVTILAIGTIMLKYGNLGHGTAVTISSLQDAQTLTVAFIGALLALPSLYAASGALAGITHRVGQLLEALDELENAISRVGEHFAERMGPDEREKPTNLRMVPSCSVNAAEERMTRSTLVPVSDGPGSARGSGWLTDPSRARPSALFAGAPEEFIALGMQNAFCKTPSNDILFRRMAFTLLPANMGTTGLENVMSQLPTPVLSGPGVVIMGPSGCGKSSLLRVLAGLWPAETGNAFRPANPLDCFFLPQRPYIFPGSLQDQITYPRRLSPVSVAPDGVLPFGSEPVSDSPTAAPSLSIGNGNDGDLEDEEGQDNDRQRLEPVAHPDEEMERMLSILRDVELSSLLDRVGGLQAHEHWGDSLSGGEQQRLGFARLLYHNPAFAILDEATSAMDAPLEERIMALLQARQIQYISVGHRVTLLACHDQVLELDGKGGHRFRNAAEVQRELIGNAMDEARQVGMAHAHPSEDAHPDDEPASPSPVNHDDTKDSQHQPHGGNLKLDPGIRFKPFTGNQPEEMKKVRFNWEFFQRFFRLFRMGFPLAFTKPTILLVVAVVLNLGSAFISSVVSIPMADLGALLASKQFKNDPEAHFSQLLVKSGVAAGVILLAAVIFALTIWIGDVLSLYWYRALVQRSHELYFRHEGRVMFAANNLVRGFDNVDQRIVTDSRLLTESFGALMFGSRNKVGVFNVLMGAIFSMALAFRAGWLPPTGGLVFSVLAIAGTIKVMQPIVPKTFVVNRCEGDFRLGHARVRERSESISFFGGNELERSTASGRFSTLYQAIRTKIWVELPARTLSLFTMLVGPIVTFGFLGLYVIMKGYVPGSTDDPHGGKASPYNTVLAISGFVLNMITNLVLLPDYLTDSSNLAAYVFRVSQLFGGLEDISDVYERFSQKRPRPLLDRPREVMAKQLTCASPDGKPLFVDLNLLVRPGCNLLIVGPSGVGKSSILRILGGLWPFDVGQVGRPARPGYGGVFFVPQRPYITPGTLREQILYPHLPSEQTCSDEDLVRLLVVLDLGYLVLRSGARSASDSPSPSSGSRVRREVQEDPRAIPSEATVNRMLRDLRMAVEIRRSQIDHHQHVIVRDDETTAGSVSSDSDLSESALLPADREASEELQDSSAPGNRQRRGGPRQRRHASIENVDSLFFGVGSLADETIHATEGATTAEARDSLFVREAPASGDATHRWQEMTEQEMGLESAPEGHTGADRSNAAAVPPRPARGPDADPFPGLDDEADWASMLSVGEQQRLGFARLLYHEPLFAIMDEATSALDLFLEHRCMLLAEAKGITCLSVGHRVTLPQHHYAVLRLRRGSPPQWLERRAIEAEAAERRASIRLPEPGAAAGRSRS